MRNHVLCEGRVIWFCIGIDAFFHPYHDLSFNIQGTGRVITTCQANGHALPAPASTAEHSLFGKAVVPGFGHNDVVDKPDAQDVAGAPEAAGEVEIRHRGAITMRIPLSSKTNGIFSTTTAV